MEPCFLNFKNKKEAYPWTKIKISVCQNGPRSQIWQELIAPWDYFTYHLDPKDESKINKPQQAI